MADTKVTALTELTTPAGVDLLYIVDDPSGTPLSRKCTVANLFLNATKIVVAEQSNTANQSSIAGWILETDGNGQKLRSAQGQFSLFNSAGVALYSSAAGISIQGYDCWLARDAANTLAIRNGTNGQTFRTYGTYTDASNYRRVAISMTTAGVASIAPEGAGTGASGNVLHISGLPTSNPGPGILWNNAGTPAIGT